MEILREMGEDHKSGNKKQRRCAVVGARGKGLSVFGRFGAMVVLDGDQWWWFVNEREVKIEDF